MRENEYWVICALIDNDSDESKQYLRTLFENSERRETQLRNRYRRWRSYRSMEDRERPLVPLIELEKTADCANVFRDMGWELETEATPNPRSDQDSAQIKNHLRDWTSPPPGSLPKHLPVLPKSR
ncbi:MAG: hypothetical protein WBD31_11440 [Rubripirellula sp.]